MLGIIIGYAVGGGAKMAMGKGFFDAKNDRPDVKNRCSFFKWNLPSPVSGFCSVAFLHPKQRQLTLNNP